MDVLAILSICFVSSNALQYKDLVDESQSEMFGHLNDDDFNDVNQYENVDIKQIIRNDLSQRGLLDPSVDDFLNNPLQKSGKFEGDIELPGDFALSPHDNYAEVAYGAIKAKRQLWRNGVIPYLISSRIGFLGRRNIAAAIADFHRETCVRIVPRTNQEDYVKLLPLSGCWSQLGRVGGEQIISLGAGCLGKHTIIHELMHASGFYHEQSRGDRDQHIDIYWQNILPGMELQFTKQPGRVLNLGTPYDLKSVLHYPETAFTMFPGKGTSGHTLRAKSGGSLGNFDGFSRLDIFKLNTLYNCNSPVIQPITESTQRPRYRHCSGHTKHRCPSGRCIDKSRLCDGFDDCGNSEDESRERCPDAVYSGDMVALQNELNNEFLSCRCTVDCGEDRCKTKSCPGSRMQGNDWDRCKGERFQIYAQDRGQNDPIRSGDKIALRYSYYLWSDHWLSCLGDRANCTSRNCPRTEMTFSGNCYGEEFIIYSPGRFGRCSNDITEKCLGEPLQQGDKVFLWSAQNSDGYHFWLSAGVKTDVCPGDYLDTYDEWSCQSQTWTLNIK